VRTERSLSKAMIVAMIYPEPEKAHKGKKAENPAKVLVAKIFSPTLLSQARTVLAFVPDLAPGVLRGEIPLCLMRRRKAT